MIASIRDHRATLTVTTLAAAFGALLLQVTGVLAAVIEADSITGSSGRVSIMLRILASVFIVVAMYVGAVVTANTVSTVVAGRIRVIALMRLIGATSGSQRARLASEGLIVGAIGAAFGVVIGSALAWGIEVVAVAVDWMPQVDYSYLDATLLIPALGVTLTTWLAAWVGSRRVLGVRPIEALGASVERTGSSIAVSRSRRVWSVLLNVAGLGLLALGILVGLETPEGYGVLIGMLGGILSFSGVVLAAPLVMPAVLRLIGRLLGSSPAARLAAENAVRHPERSTRTTIGLVIGVTLVTTFAVTMESVQQLMAEAVRVQPETYAGVDEMVNIITGIFTVLIGFSAIIAAIGLVNTLSISVLQRTRELGLLRALGFERRQLRGMIIAESAALTGAATATGLVLGFAYGWAGAQALLGSPHGDAVLVVPSVPWVFVVGILAAAAALTVLASITPAQRAMRVSPVEALAVS